MLKFWELAPSPNSTKVRMALRFKNIDFEAIPVDPVDRDAVLKMSGQVLTPVIEDKGIILNDSEAILQYLDANYPESPRLFPRDRGGRRECEDWKKELDEKIAKPWMPVFFHLIGRFEECDQDALKSYHEALAWLDRLVADKDQIQEGENKSICDLRVAEWATYALPGPGFIARCRLMGKSKEVFAVKNGQFKHLERYLEKWNGFLA
ncbi:MAG: glutathione S-transferase family protein [Planctomycetota bacterium]|nr:glutathione S-transferase family protein [Planctomycetota bacterium]